MIRNVSMLEFLPPFEFLECAGALCLALTRLAFSASCFSLIILCIGHNPEKKCKTDCHRLLWPYHAIAVREFLHTRNPCDHSSDRTDFLMPES